MVIGLRVEPSMPLGRPMGGLEGSELVQRKIKSSGRESFILREVLCAHRIRATRAPNCLFESVRYPIQRSESPQNAARSISAQKAPISYVQFGRAPQRSDRTVD